MYLFTSDTVIKVWLAWRLSVWKIESVNSSNFSKPVCIHFALMNLEKHEHLSCSFSLALGKIRCRLGSLALVDYQYRKLTTLNWKLGAPNLEEKGGGGLAVA